MNSIIEEFYASTGTLPGIIEKKKESFERHPDIKKEFEYWIQHKAFYEDGLSIAGYTAKGLAALSEHLNGEAAFDLLIELRENPEKARKRLNRGFSLK